MMRLFWIVIEIRGRNAGLVGSGTEHSVAHKDIHQGLREDGV